MFVPLAEDVSSGVAPTGAAVAALIARDVTTTRDRRAPRSQGCMIVPPTMRVCEAFRWQECSKRALKDNCYRTMFLRVGDRHGVGDVLIGRTDQPLLDDGTHRTYWF